MNPNWNPYDHLDGRNPSKECLKRIRTDLKSITDDPLPGIYCVHDDTHATVIHALVVGPFDTPYEGGFFHFILNFPDDYPHNPPRVMLKTTGGGTVRFNPNLYANGKVCLSILGTWSGPAWSTVHSLGSILMSIQSLMNDKPFHNEPGYEVANNSTDVINYNDCIRHETIRVAVVDFVTSNTSIIGGIPVHLLNVAKSLFISFFDSYLITCQEYEGMDGNRMIDPFGESRGIFCYHALSSKLNDIFTKIENEIQKMENTDEAHEEKKDS